MIATDIGMSRETVDVVSPLIFAQDRPDSDPLALRVLMSARFEGDPTGSYEFPEHCMDKRLAIGKRGGPQLSDVANRSAQSELAQHAVSLTSEMLGIDERFVMTVQTDADDGELTYGGDVGLKGIFVPILVPPLSALPEDAVSWHPLRWVHTGHVFGKPGPTEKDKYYAGESFADARKESFTRAVAIAERGVEDIGYAMMAVRAHFEAERRTKILYAMADAALCENTQRDDGSAPWVPRNGLRLSGNDGEHFGRLGIDLDRVTEIDNLSPRSNNKGLAIVRAFEHILGHVGGVKDDRAKRKQEAKNDDTVVFDALDAEEGWNTADLIAMVRDVTGSEVDEKELAERW